MTIIFVRHSDDEGGSCSKLHDCKITYDGKRLAFKTGNDLISRYGVPNIIYCSPFRRTIETMESMLSSVDSTSITIYHDVRISRYFSGRQKHYPDIDPKTDITNLPIDESFDDFKRRVRRFIRFIEHYAYRDELVWVVTHALVYKQVAKYYDRVIPNPIPFMHYLRVGNKRPRHLPSVAEVEKRNEVIEQTRRLRCRHCNNGGN